MKHETQADNGLVFRSSQKPIVLQQRRLRNVTLLGIRNLTIALPLTDATSSNIKQADPLIYFTISTSAGQGFEENVFMSEKIHYSENPTWSCFKITMKPNIKISEFDVRLWIGQGDHYLPALHWNLVVTQLRCIGDELFNEKVTFHSNSVVIGIRGMFYASNHSVTIASDFELQVLADMGDAAKSYSVTALHKLLVYRRSMIQKQQLIADHHRRIVILNEQRKASNQLNVDLENMQNKVVHLKALLKREKEILASERVQASKRLDHLNDAKAALDANKEELEGEVLQHRDAFSNYISSRESVTHLGSQLGVRRKNILSQLSDIFPIVKVPMKQRNENQIDVFSICGAILPDAEHLHSKEDTQTSVALNFTAQLLTMVSQFLLVPLRYPITHKGANLLILDHVTDKLSDKERMFPLFVKGNKDRFLFEYGVFLFNKDIAQLRYYFGMGTSDLRLTLRNIHSLLVERLGAKVMFHSNPIMINKTRQSRLSSVDSGVGSESRPRVPLLVLPSKTSEASLYRSDAASSFSSLQSHDSVMTKAGKMTSSADSSPSKAIQRVGYRNTELTSLRGELFGTKTAPVRDRSPSALERNQNSERKGKPPDLSIPNNNSSTSLNHLDSIESVSPTLNPPRTHLTGLEEIGQSHAPKSDSRSSKVKLASARAELLGKKTTRWGSRSSSKLSSERSNSTVSTDSMRYKSDSVTSRNRTSSSFSEDGDDSAPGKSRNKEDLPYMSAIGNSHSNGVSKQKDAFRLDDKINDAHVNDQSVDELDLC